MTTAVAARTTAPLGRVLLAELRWVLRRPRNLASLAVLALMPVLIGIAVVLTGGPDGGDGPPALATVAGNGLVLPVATLVLAQSMLLPLVVSMTAADALAGESAHGTLRGLVMAPISRTRLVGVKAVGVLVMTVLSVVVIGVSGVLTGLVIVGGGDLVTMSGTTLPMGSGLGRVALAVGWSVVQMAAVGAIALAISSFTDHPLMVMVTTMGALIVFGVLGALPALDWLHPLLITKGWASVMEVLRDPIATGPLVDGLLRAGCYVVIGVSAAVFRMSSKDV
ncbi:ABC transporter permease [Saccharopolyspora taberi]|uniref:ABC transporter permease subunit n=1 Tax=Saccharopolyspora taberi TaxID=60895 RepID=A0ABN3VJY6_9PSEU